MDLSELIQGTSFRWREALYLPKWGVAVFPDSEQKGNIIKIANKLELIRGLLNKPMVITSFLRPDKYNLWKPPYGVSGAPASAHVKGLAVDFYVDQMSCDEVRTFLEPKLEELQIRMERKPKSSWVHIDAAPVQTSRYFFP